MNPWHNPVARRLLRGLREMQRRHALAGRSTAVRATDAPVILARIIGNDLWPRHAEGQALRNLEVILRDEPDFPGAEKLFVLNRMFDPAAEAEAERMVRARGHAVLKLPFDPEAYAALACDTGFFGGDGYFADPAFAALDDNSQSRRRLWVCAEKIRYAINVNGARNAALDWGAVRGGWTLPLDGSCFVPQATWDRLRGDMAGPPALRYLILPMQRLATTSTRAAQNPAGPVEEPQVAFHPAAAGRFDPLYPYGMRDKVALLDALGLPGLWNLWARQPWLPRRPARLPDRHCYAIASAPVLRLTSGVAGGALERDGASLKRYQSRNAALFRTLAMLDARIGTADRARAARIMGTGKWRVEGTDA